MSGKDLIVDPTKIDYSNIVADIEEIRRHNPQRDAMEQLTAIVLDDPENNLCIGYRDLSGSDEFWHTGHMPGIPLMPGVIMCEVAAQVCSFHSHRHDLLGCEVMGFGGLDGVRFRGILHPGDRLTVACQVTNVRRGRLIAARFQGFVDVGGDEFALACEGEIRGVPLPVDELRQR
ncbi:MAG: beta-hydroxyacyl-ACP dehydratase [Planctomycetota bacterium]